MTQRVLVAIDLYDKDRTVAPRLVEHAGRVASAMGFKLDVVAVIIPVTHYAWLIDGAALDRAQRLWQQELRGHKEKLATLLSAVPKATRGSCIVEPDPVLLALERLAPSYALVVMGNRPARGWDRMKHGDVAERFMQWSTVPVLVVPEPGNAVPAASAPPAK